MARREFFIVETRFDGEHTQRLFWLSLPEVGEDGFYRQVSSFNAFFNSLRNPKSNRTDKRQFTARSVDERKFYEGVFRVDWDDSPSFDSIWDFYREIGYDYKRRKYSSGERMKTWDGEKFK